MVFRYCFSRNTSILLALRLVQKVLNDCIDNSQSAFVPGRLISDNVMPAFKILQFFNQKRRGWKHLMTLKLDISKA